MRRRPRLVDVFDEAPELYDRVRPGYETWMPGTLKGERLPEADDVPHGDRDELQRDGRFTDAAVRRYERELSYTTREYCDLLSTYSGHRALAADAREALLGCIAELMDSRFTGRIAKRYMTELTVAYRAARA